jgi:Asp-tRNA(Asn)/Glu-tRNA(Gln) amidotransferase A subunit family amidase
LYDLKGLQTSGGSQAWARITPTANGTAPAVQQIIDLGGIIVGKQKLAQFASGANPWEWQDEHYPFNPRGDGWLTCSASSSGGGCSIAAYDWLDYAIGSDTGSSMRRPAAVAGIYGQRPSQGAISLERVIPLGAATDTAGVFSRDPYKWIKFAKNWYSSSLHQDVSVTGLSPLSFPDTDAFPKTILYPTDYLPLNNSAAEPILQAFIANMSRIFNMTVKEFNFTATVQNFSSPIARNLTTLNSATSVINNWTAWQVVGKPLITAWKTLFDGRFPPIDPARRPGWIAFNESVTNQTAYDAALVTKNIGVEWYERELQYSTPDSCSESIMLYDIGTGGLPSFR